MGECWRPSERDRGEQEWLWPAAGAPSLQCSAVRRQAVSRRSVTVRAAELSKPQAPPTPKPDSEAPKAAAAAAPGVTVEYQRAQVKEMTKYFKRLKNAQLAANAPVFGWTPDNEISNGRWVMFGLLVGCLTEYATGVDFIDQIKLMGALFGLVDTD